MLMKNVLYLLFATRAPLEAYPLFYLRFQILMQLGLPHVWISLEAPLKAVQIAFLEFQYNDYRSFEKDICSQF